MDQVEKLNLFIKDAHQVARSKGFWDKERNTGELLMLIVSECGEALEAHRKGKHVNLSAYERDLNDPAIERTQVMNHEEDPRVPLSSLFEYAFRTNIKDTFEDELADVVIRICDLMGDLKHVIGRGPVEHRYINVGEDLLHVVKLVSQDHPDYLEAALHYTFAIAQYHNIDLWKHIELKMDYNRSRERLHGKAY